MRRFRLLEIVSTRFLGLTAVFTIVLVVGAYTAVLRLGFATVDTIGKFVDAVFKAVALLVGTLWAINRYFVERTDAPQFRVDCTVSMVHGPKQPEPALLIFRLDLVNTGKVQIGAFQHYVEIDEARATSEGVELRPMYRWPNDGWHPGGLLSLALGQRSTMNSPARHPLERCAFSWLWS